MKNKVLLTIILNCFITLSSMANTTPTLPITPSLKPVNSATTSTMQTQNQTIKHSTPFETCVRAYQTSTDNLYLLMLAAINSSGYQIDEIQSKRGLVSFLADNRSFLASITELDENSSMLKITPMNNSYNFSPAIIENIFLYLSKNMKER